MHKGDINPFQTNSESTNNGKEKQSLREFSGKAGKYCAILFIFSAVKNLL